MYLLISQVLVLLLSLRQSFMAERRQSLLSPNSLETTSFIQSSVGAHNTLNHKFILQRILNWMIVSGSSSQKTRVNLYGALLNFMRIANGKYSEDDDVKMDVESTYVSRLDSTIARVKSGNEEAMSIKLAVVEAVNECGNALRECISSDATGASHEVCRVMALAVLEELVALQQEQSWTQTQPWTQALMATGHLTNLIDSLLKDDAALKQVNLYTYSY